MDHETLSSWSTPLMKLFACAMPIIQIGASVELVQVMRPLVAIAAVLVPGLSLSAGLLWLAMPCRRVVATRDGLEVGKLGEHRTVAYKDIRSVRAYAWVNPKVVVVEAADRSFRFFARSEASSGWREPAAAKLIRERAGLS